MERRQRQLQITSATKGGSAQLSRITFIAEGYTDIFTHSFGRSDTSVI